MTVGTTPPPPVTAFLFLEQGWSGNPFLAYCTYRQLVTCNRVQNLSRSAVLLSTDEIKESEVEKSEIGGGKIKSSEVGEGRVQGSEMGESEMEGIEVENWEMEDSDLEE